MDPFPLRIGQLARRLSTTAKTIRFYEEIGLLRSPARADSGYRTYDQHAHDQAARILGLRRLGLSIDELKDLLAAAGGSVRKRLSALMDERLRAVELELGVLQGRRDELAARHQALLATPRDRPGDCICDALFEPCTCSPLQAPGPSGDET
ncbi:MAG: MerR family DNA-binding transcriptional regulator [Pseudomonadota bacterium]|nr:MerR family DNA-binding transcriptional regulator [Pseudomonadota bacterium]